MRSFFKFSFLFAALFAFRLSAQIESHEMPPSFFENNHKTLTPKISIPKPDLTLLKTEDLEEDQIKHIPKRFGVEEKVNINLSNSGQWESLQNGRMIWKLILEGKEAKSINLNFSSFYLPESAQLFLSNHDYSDVIGAITYKNNKIDGLFATRPLKGDFLRIELIVDSTEQQAINFVISGVVYGYRGFFSNSEKTFGASGNCNVNVECEAGKYWRNIASSVVLITSADNTRRCSGTLLNNTSQDSTPYILSAAHCPIQTNSVFIFDYKSPNCSPSVDGSLHKSVSGAYSRAFSNRTDFHLLELSSPIPSSYNVTYAGWDATNRIPIKTTALHHPSNDVMKISHDDDPPITTGSWGSSGTSHWTVEGWDLGTTEGGSSGSGLFDEFQRVIGQLEGGAAACNRDLEDYYGKIAESWIGNGNPSGQLKHWLDPSNSGQLKTDPMMTDIPVNQWDFASIYIHNPVGLVCGEDSLTTYALVKNYSSDLTNNLKIVYRINTKIDTIEWTGNSNYGEVLKIDLPTLPLSDSANRIEITGFIPDVPVATNTSNDTIGFDIWAVKIPSPIYMTFKTDNYGEETSWEISTLDNTTLFMGGTFQNINGGKIYRDTICLYDSCFNFKIYDVYGDGFNDPTGSNGNGYALIRNAKGDTLVFENNFKSASKTTYFCNQNVNSLAENESKSSFKLFPNPIQSGSKVSISSDFKYDKVNIYDLNGRLLIELNEKKETFQIPNLKSGTYIMEISSKKYVQVKRQKLIIYN